MPTFASLREIAIYEKVSYYSLLLEDERMSLFEKFLDTYRNSEFRNDLQHIMYWIQYMGKNHGAKAYFFRKEQDAEALPPPGKILKIEHIKLRLYCCVLSENVVILLDGGVKTASKAQNCPNVGPSFRKANRISIALTKCIQQKTLLLKDELNNRLQFIGANEIEF
ncbi:MAG: hypothetical protein IPM26_01240 [Saprospiraceae bacterium]|nr:hypothetical protein [Saprospiraceae bacterium]